MKTKQIRMTERQLKDTEKGKQAIIEHLEQLEQVKARIKGEMDRHLADYNKIAEIILTLKPYTDEAKTEI